MAPAIPDRWIDYKACGRIIEGTKFICFKVPLKKSVQMNNEKITETWDIPAVLSTIPDLGAVIDLTNTNRYYNPVDFENAGVLHRKLLMPGRIIPPEPSVKKFMGIVDSLLGEIGDSLIGVHCTHGLNRTGYMVCRYMRDRMSIPGNLAIKKFEKARGYQIERENYIADILGKNPPPPQFGDHTTVVPVEDEEQTNNHQSSMNNHQSSTNNHRSSTNNHRSSTNNYLSWRQDRHDDTNAGGSKSNFGNFNKGNNDSKRGKRRESDDDSSFKYDYRHDY